MKKSILFSTIIISLMAMSSKANTAFRLLTQTERINDTELMRELSSTSVDNNISALIDLISISRNVQNQSKLFANKLVNKIKQGKTISGIELSTINQFMRTSLILSDKFMDLIGIYYRENNTRVYVPNNLIKTKYNLIVFSAYLEMVNLYHTTYRDYFKRSTIRRVIKDLYRTEQSKNKNILRLKELLTLYSKQQFRHYISKLAKNFVWKEQLIINYHDPILNKLSSTTKKSNVLIMTVKKEIPLIQTFNIIDYIVKTFNDATNFISGVFGNAVGAVRWRHGYLYKHSSVKKYLLTKLKPLDIIAEKTPFALTDLFIPGHFGHIAIWLGTEEQLREIGIWEHPAISPHQERIRNGYNILQSIRPGSDLTTLDKFLEIDEITVMRQENILDDYEVYERIYKQAMNQMYKKYDFNFDVHTLEKVVCSEVVYHAYGEIEWPTSYLFGRNTITPDQVISLSFYDKSPVQFSFALIGDKSGAVKVIKKDTMAKNLSFQKNVARSTQLGRDAYDMQKKVCQTYKIKQNRRRSRSRRSGELNSGYRKRCKTTYSPAIYGQ